MQKIPRIDYLDEFILGHETLAQWHPISGIHCSYTYNFVEVRLESQLVTLA